MRSQFRLKTLLPVSFILALVSTVPANAAHYSKSTGVGIVLGEPTGFTAKFWQDAHVAYDVGLAYSFESFFQMYGDYLYHWPGAFGNSSRFASELAPYVGGGAFLVIATSSGTTNNNLVHSSGNSVGFGMRIPLGIEWTPSQPPLGVFVEVVPGVGLVPSTFGYLQGGVGVRWYF